MKHTVDPPKAENSPQMIQAAKEIYLATKDFLGEDFGAVESSLGAASLYGEFVRTANYGADANDIPTSFKPSQRALTYLKEMSIGLGINVGQVFEHPSYDEILSQVTSNLHTPTLYSGDAYYGCWIKPKEMAAKLREPISKIADDHGLNAWQRVHAFSVTMFNFANIASESVYPPAMLHLHCVEAMLHAAHRSPLPSQDKSIKPPVFLTDENCSQEGECLYKVALNAVCRASGYNPESLSTLPDGIADMTLNILCALAGGYAMEAGLKKEPNVQGLSLPQSTESFLREVYSFFVESAGHPTSREELLVPYEREVEDFLQKSFIGEENKKKGSEAQGLILVEEHLAIHAAEKNWDTWTKASICGCAALLLAQIGNYLSGEDKPSAVPVKKVKNAYNSMLSSAFRKTPLLHRVVPRIKPVNFNNDGWQNTLS